MNKMKLYWLTTLLFWSFTLAAQQLPSGNNRLPMRFIWNPAYTGALEFMEFGAAYKQQWIGFEDAPTSVYAFINSGVPKTKMGVGGYILQDNIGPLTSESVGLSYAYRLPVSRKENVSIGLKARMQRYRANNFEFVSAQPEPWQNGIDIDIPWGVNIGAGLLFHSQYEYREKPFYYFGLAADQLIQRNAFFNNTNKNTPGIFEDWHFSATIGYRFFPTGETSLEFSSWIDYSWTNIWQVLLQFSVEFLQTVWITLEGTSSGAAGLQIGYILNGDNLAFLKEGELIIGVTGNYQLKPLGQYEGFKYSAEAGIAYRFDIRGSYW